MKKKSLSGCKACNDNLWLKTSCCVRTYVIALKRIRRFQKRPVDFANIQKKGWGSSISKMEASQRTVILFVLK